MGVLSGTDRAVSCAMTWSSHLGLRVWDFRAKVLQLADWDVVFGLRIVRDLRDVDAFWISEGEESKDKLEDIIPKPSALFGHMT